MVKCLLWNYNFYNYVAFTKYIIVKMKVAHWKKEKTGVMPDLQQQDPD